jgi:ribosomal protein L37AE/L43A
MASDKERPNGDTPTVYSREEAKQIREMVKASKDPPTCPRCDEPLTIGPAALHQVGGKEYTVRALTCPVCRRLLSIRDKPEQR